MLSENPGAVRKINQIHSFLFKRTILEEHRGSNFPKTTNNSKFDHGNFSDERLDQENHFKHVFGVGVE